MPDDQRIKHISTDSEVKAILWAGEKGSVGDIGFPFPINNDKVLSPLPAKKN